MFNKGDKLLLIILSVEIIIFYILQEGPLQYVEYYVYASNIGQYSVVTAEVEKTHRIEPHGRLILRWKWADIVYEYGGQQYNATVHSYPELTEEREILIAVKTGNPQRVLRCVPYKLTKKNEIHIIVFLSLIICMILFVIIKNKILEKNSKVHTDSFKEEISKQEADKQKCERKKEYILSHLKSNEEVLYNKELVSKLQVLVHEDFIWCLKYLSKTDVANNILLLGIDGNGEYEFVSETVNLRERGLPKQYYAIAKVENNYLCGRADSHRIYCFSESLGITNTPYATIFDYIIKKIT
ncbi:MAG: SMI1/KNR4 family protein [Lachnospiraceae bacterium]|nr:SMI1/KNR4 family protein [Lachnospiraceae bacterium]